MSFTIPDAKAVAASSLKSAYLAMFSLLGPRGGYSYVLGDALTPIRQRIVKPLKTGAIGEYVIKAKAPYVEIVNRDVSFKDIMLVSEPLPCWILKIADHLVVLPLTGDSRISQPLRELLSLGGGQPFTILSPAYWSFSTFGASYTVSVRLAGADTAKSLVGLRIRGTLPNGRPLAGVCISHSGESATLLCPGPTI